ncbi:helix-turn-helix transcriptional regulator [Sinorhizobium meliloti]|uniref:helix-turn-helix transcriptional regulator n=1 Tax=Rhizobium meliloti TaxID=382 RepID=UPI000FDB2C56|nr:helix-turn-helix domain-containing protein [Sinorhizobium meliloti]RVG14964.1 helix-turn-helix domain-containing protein [Sinorhizobium meliloti]
MTALRAGRALLGLSQEELAGLAGVSRQIVVRIEKCEINVLVESIEKGEGRARGRWGRLHRRLRRTGVAMIQRPRPPAGTE